MTVDTITLPLTKIIEFLAVQSQTPAQHLDASTPVFGSVVFRSMLVLQLIAFLEKTFAIEIGPDELVPDNFRTIGTVADFITIKIADAPSAATT